MHPNLDGSTSSDIEIRFRGAEDGEQTAMTTSPTARAAVASAGLPRITSSTPNGSSSDSLTPIPHCPAAPSSTPLALALAADSE
eukprot:2484779-Rhodomonas_salina.1